MSKYVREILEAAKERQVRNLVVEAEDSDEETGATAGDCGLLALHSVYRGRFVLKGVPEKVHVYKISADQIDDNDIPEVAMCCYADRKSVIHLVILVVFILLGCAVFFLESKTNFFEKLVSGDDALIRDMLEVVDPTDEQNRRLKLAIKTAFRRDYRGGVGKSVHD